MDPAHGGADATYNPHGADGEHDVPLPGRRIERRRLRRVVRRGQRDDAERRGAGTQPPDAPTSVSATASDESRIDAPWTAPSGDLTGYDVQWSADGNSNWQAVDPVHKGAGTKYSDTGLAAGTTRSYRCVR